MRRTHSEILHYNAGMAGSRSGVSFTDSEGFNHGVDVDAEGLQEAIAVAQLREDEVSPTCQLHLL